MLENRYLRAVWLVPIVLVACARGPHGTSSGETSPSSHASARLVPASPAAAAAANVPATFVSSHPRAAWRLASRAELDTVVVWVSQIVVRHRDSREEVSFSPAYWFSVPPRVQRPREEALALAQVIAEKAAREPQRFGELAKQYSEDISSRDEGGSLGGVQASQLEPWPHVLDALAAIGPGQSSGVVETAYGFHVFYRSAPPPETTLSGAHLVIGHDQAQWLETFARNKRPSRSREDALTLARELSRQARAEPARFAELVRRYSEHRDAEVDGDFGAWSTREPNDYPPRIARLRALAVGEVGAPIETHLGFEIVRRTPLRPRERFRARMAIIPVATVDTEVPRPLDASLRNQAFEKATALARLCAAGPSCFDPLNPGATELEWEEGRQFAALTPVLKALRPGQIASQPVLSDDGFVIAQRLVPHAAPTSAWKTELPAPASPDPASFIESLSISDTVGFLRQFAARVAVPLLLPAPIAERLRALHDLEGRLEPDTSPEGKRQLFGEVLAGTRQLLGDVSYAAYGAALRSAVAATLLGAAADSPEERGL